MIKGKIPARKIWLSTRDYLMIMFGTLLYAAGFCGLVLPQKVVIGGVTGVGSLVYYSSGIPVAVTQYAINLVLLALAYRTVGKRFVLKTIFGATCISLFIGVLQPVMGYYFPEGVVPGQPFMCILIGGFLAGLSLGLIFVHNGSTGGTDIVCAIVSKRSTISVGRTMLYVDFCIIASSYLLFHSIDKIVYGLVFLFITSYVCDQIINSNRQAVSFQIISPKWEKIADAINSVAHRGCTVIDAQGWYSKNEMKLLMVVCRVQESVLIFRITQSIDPSAFIMQVNMNGVYGLGFDVVKVKTKPIDIDRLTHSGVTEGDGVTEVKRAESALQRDVNADVHRNNPGGHPSSLA